MKGLAPALFLLNSLTVGGSEKKVVAVVNALTRRGREVHLAYLNQPETLLSDVDPAVPTLWLRRSGKFDPGTVGRLASYCRDRQIRRIFCVNEYPALYGSTASRLAGRDCDYTAFINTTTLPRRMDEVKMLVYAPLLRRTRQVVFGCSQQRAMWTARYRLDDSRCTHIYNGIDADRFCRERLPESECGLRRSLGWSERDVVIGMVGQLLPKKGYPDFLAALARLRDQGKSIKGLIVGAGPERIRLEATAEQLGLTRDIAFVGELADVRQALYAMDVFALSSIAVETFSNAALEAMSMELPVVMSQIGGAAEMVEPDVSGYLYPAGDVDALAAGLGLLVERPELRRRIGEQARRRVLERFTFERMVEQYELLLPRRDERNAAEGVSVV